jgi:two-component system, response regulator YesN
MLARLDTNKIQLLQKDQQFVDSVFAWIDENFSLQWRLSDLAKKMHLSESHLSAVLKKHTGRSAGDWIKERRMEEARKLILKGRRVGLVAEQVGYLDQSLFIHHFSQIHGATPKKWQQLAIQNH